VEKLVKSVDYITQLTKITLHSVVDQHGVAGDIFSSLGQQGLNVELISTNSIGHGRCDISFAVMEANVDDVLKILETIKDKFGTRKIVVNKNCALITVYGSMLTSTPGIAGKIFTKLAERKINIEMINASLSALSVVVSKEKAMDAVGAIRTEFGI
jgi:aspartate kinase